jgi:TRAP-type C4-dicarboxylate transport system permease small subunit
MSALLRMANRAALTLAHSLAVSGLIALMVLATMVMADGTLRWLTNQPIEGVRDIGSLVIAFAVSCCMPIALIEKAHICVHILEPVIGATLGRILSAFAALAVAVVMGLMAWQFWLYAGKLAHGHETTVVLRIPIAPFWYVVDFVLWCAAAIQLVVALNEIASFKKMALAER